jgi:uncharacterized membrane protein
VSDYKRPFVPGGIFFYFGNYDREGGIVAIWLAEWRDSLRYSRPTVYYGLLSLFMSGQQNGGIRCATPALRFITVCLVYSGLVSRMAGFAALLPPYVVYWVLKIAMIEYEKSYNWRIFLLKSVFDFLNH